MTLDYENIINTLNLSKNNKKVGIDGYCSLSFLLKDILNLSQSEKIKLGNNIEKFLNKTCIMFNGYKKLEYKFLFKCQIDELLINEDTKTIIYSEYKSNIALDSQKRKVMYTHCLKINNLLAEKYPDYTIKACIVNTRFLHIKDIPLQIRNRYKNMKKIKLYGINDYLNLLKIDCFDNYQDYTKFLKYLHEKI